MITMSSKIRTLIVDDSKAMRMLLSQILSEDPDIEVVGMAGDPLEARDMIKSLNPDVITLDIEMPRMDGLTFLEKLMRMRPMPVIMVSSLTHRSSEASMEALSLGALDVVAKPTVNPLGGLEDAGEELRSKVRMAAKAKLRNSNRVFTSPSAPAPKNVFVSQHRVIAIGSSTGGTEAIRQIIPDLSRDCPPIAIVQHIPPGFAESFAERLNQICTLNVRTAVDGEVMKNGNVYVAPGGLHMRVLSSGNALKVRISDDAPVNRHRPSVDVLFESVAMNVGKNAIGVILTGMGDDGAMGMQLMKDAGADTIAQDEATCVVFGMPAQAIARGVVDTIAPLEQVAPEISKLLSVRTRR